MDKTYFEMNEAEKQLSLINNIVDYAICMFSEGLPVYKDKETTRRIIYLQNSIVRSLLDVSVDISELMELIKERRTSHETP